MAGGRRGDLDGVFRDGHGDGIRMPTDDKLGAQGSRGDVAAVNDEGAFPVGCYGKGRFSCEEVNLPPFRGVDHVECAFGVQYDAGAVLQHNLFLLSDPRSVMGGLEAVLIEQGGPEEPSCREKEAGDKAPWSESRPPSMMLTVGRPGDVGRCTLPCAYMTDLFP